MERRTAKDLLKQGAARAVMMTEKEFEKKLLLALRLVMDMVPEVSSSELEEIISDGLIKDEIDHWDLDLMVIRLDRGREFVFIAYPEELLKFIRKHYGSIEDLIDRVGRK
jgi:hypothetical protein